MQFCDQCGEAMVKVDGEWICRTCEPDAIESESESGGGISVDAPRTDLEDLPTTDSGSVRKVDAMRWLDSLDEPSDRELKRAVVPKPSDFEGSTYATAVSNVRITGDPSFVETVAGLFRPLADLENNHTLLQINLQRAEDRETGEETGNYALYLTVAERA